MNPFQQLAALDLSPEESDAIAFDNMASYLKWKSEGNN